MFALPQAVKNILSTAEGPAVAEGTCVVRGWVPGFTHADVPDGAGSLVPIVSPNNGFSLIYYYKNGAAYGIWTYDGTTTKYSLLQPANGTSYDLAVRWSSSTNLMQVGQKLSSTTTWTWSTTAAFDGAYTMGTNLNIGYTPLLPHQLGSVEIYDKWLSEDEL